MSRGEMDAVISVHGTVQGVGFRWWTRRQLEALGLEGVATNQPDGSVLIHTAGDRRAVEQLLRTLRGGRTPGHVTDARLVGVDGPATPGRGPDDPASPAATGGPLSHDPVRRRPDHEVVVVGGGPAGLSAALVLGRSRRDVLVVDDATPRNRWARHMHGYLGHDGVPPEDFLDLAHEEVARYGVQVRRGTVTRLLPAPTESLIEVTLGDGTTLTARRVLVTTGLRDELPDIGGLAERWGRDVLHCPYCHGWEYRDARLVVVASAVDELDKALTVRQWSGAVDLVLQGLPEDEVPEPTRRRLAAVGVRVVPGPVQELVVDRDRVIGVRLATQDVLPCDAVVVQPRVVARDGLLVGVGVEVASGAFGQFVVADETGATGVPGVYAAGNVARPEAQVVVAAADGFRAAVAIDHDLVMEDVDAAVRAEDTRREDTRRAAPAPGATVDAVGPPPTRAV